jgi:hypothetical protein
VSLGKAVADVQSLYSGLDGSRGPRTTKKAQ